MEHPNRLSKWLLFADLALCGVWLLMVSYIFYDPYLMLFPMLHIWLSILTYSRSRLAWCPMGLLAIVSLPLLKQFAPIYELWLSPFVKISCCVLSLFGGNRELVTDFLLLRLGQGTLDLWESQLLVWCLGLVWLVGIPLAIYFYRAAHKHLIPSALSRKQSWGLFGYMLLVIWLFSTGFFYTFGFYENLAAGVLAVSLIPVLFCKGTKPLLTKGQTTELSILALLTIGFIVGTGMEEKSILTILTIPIAVYALINRCVGCQTPYWEYLLLAVAMFCFWQAQNAVDGAHIALLAEYDKIEILVPYRPYFKVMKSGK